MTQIDILVKSKDISKLDDELTISVPFLSVAELDFYHRITNQPFTIQSAKNFNFDLNNNDKKLLLYKGKIKSKKYYYSLTTFPVNDDNFNLNEISDENKIKLMSDYANGLRFLHETGYLHNNITLKAFKTNKGHGFLGDLDMITCVDIEVMNNKTKYETFDFVYRAPESFVKYENYYLTNDKTDIWALGIAFLHMFLNENLYVLKYSKKYMSEKSYEKINLLIENKINGDFVKDEIIVECIRYQQEKLFGGNVFERYIKILSIVSNEKIAKIITGMLDFDITNRFSILDVCTNFDDKLKCLPPIKLNIIDIQKPFKWDTNKTLCLSLILTNNMKYLLDMPLETIFVAFDVMYRTLAGLDFNNMEIINYIAMSAMNIAMNLYDISFNCIKGKRCIELELSIIKYLNCVIRRTDYLYLLIDSITNAYKRYDAFNKFIVLMTNFNNVSEEFFNIYSMVDMESFIHKFFIDSVDKQSAAKGKVVSLLDPPKTIRQLDEMMKMDIFKEKEEVDDKHKYIDFTNVKYNKSTKFRTETNSPKKIETNNRS